MSHRPQESESATDNDVTHRLIRCLAAMNPQGRAALVVVAEGLVSREVLHRFDSADERENAEGWLMARTVGITTR